MQPQRTDAQDHADFIAERVIEAERSVIGAACRDLSLVSEIGLYVSHEDFTGHRRDLARALFAIHAEGQRAAPPGSIQRILGPAFTRPLHNEWAECQGHITARENIDAAAREILEASVRRANQELGSRLAAGEIEPHEASAALTATVQRLSAGTGWAYTVDADTIEDDSIDYPDEPCLLGDDLLCPGDLAILYGQPGLGKSWIAMDLVYRIARGESWYGLKPPTEPMRVGFLSLEINGRRLQKRKRAIRGEREWDELDRNAFWISRPRLRGPVDLLTAESQRDLAGWCRSRQLALCIVDATSRIHHGNENDPEHIGGLTDALDRIREDTGAAIMLVHHERKTPPGQKDEDDDLNALRGSSRFQSDPTLLVRLKAVNRDSGLMVVRCAKSNNGETFSPIYLMQQKHGAPIVTTSPEAKGDATTESVRRILLEHPTGISMRSLADATGHSRATVYRHIRILGARNIGVAKAAVFVLDPGDVSHASHLGSETHANPYESQGFSDDY